MPSGDINVDADVKDESEDKCDRLSELSGDEDLTDKNFSPTNARIHQFKESSFIIWCVEEQKRLCVGVIKSVDRENKLCVVHYFGTYSKSANLGEHIFRPSWQSPQGWCVFQSKCP